ncbi:hypothetical protein Pmani_017779 [Petrolisthes manimaculis]|uniref:Uncharacterized protein n=1 Tax=Petrolisthes manimaculis TaxID=1843537 RepID=A0AAE1PNS1_9EUCA|nr:hypothetical protein Pmani_017779 [Petrolisthes manimaculis]
MTAEQYMPDHQAYYSLVPHCSLPLTPMTDSRVLEAGNTNGEESGSGLVGLPPVSTETCNNQLVHHQKVGK